MKYFSIIILLIFVSNSGVLFVSTNRLDGIVTDPNDNAHQACVKLFPKNPVDVNNTRFENRRCLLHCFLAGHPMTEFINQNRSCPEDSTGFCDFGVCRHNYTNTLGRLNVTIYNAEFYEKPTNALVELCVHNSSERIPFYYHEPENCTQCSTETPTKLTRTPVWNISCDDVSAEKWNLNSLLFFRVYNFTQNGTEYSNQTIVGTTKLTITQMLSDLKNGVQQYLPLWNSRNIGRIFIKVLWKPDSFLDFVSEEENYEEDFQ